jgi:hypothetical protein
MELIILQDGIYNLISVTKEMINLKVYVKLDCFDLCKIIQETLTTYHGSWNSYFMNDGSGQFIGCIC